MRFTAATIATGLLAIRPVAADFYIFCGAENQFPDASQQAQATFFNNPPSCDDAVNSIPVVFTFYNDASGGGIACDGCDGAKAPQDWDVQRFEVYDDNSAIFASDEAHFTLYKDETNGGWGMYGTDNNFIGTCVKPDPVQIYTCPDVLSADNAAGIFHCTNTFLSIRNSN